MSELTVYADNDADTPLLQTQDFDQIRDALGRAGIRLERWQADRELPDDADWVNQPKRIDKIIFDAIASVCGTVPIAV